MNSIFVLFTITLVLSTCNGAHDGYTELEVFLTRNVDTDVPNINLQKIRDILDFGLEISGSRVKFDNSVVDAMRDIVGLLDIKEEIMKCDSNEQSYLARLSIIVGVVHRFYQNRSNLTRLQSIVHHKNLEHARTCIRKYPERFEEKLLSFVDDNSIELVNKFTANFVSRRRMPGRILRHYMVWLATNKPTALDDYIQTAFEHLMVLVLAKLELPVVPELIPESIFREFLRGPCERYEMHFGPDLFELTRFDQGMFASVASAYNLLSPEAERLVPYFRAMANYEICKTVVRSEYFASEVMSRLRQNI